MRTSNTPTQRRNDVMRHSTKFDLKEVEQDFRDPETLELRIPLERFDVVLELSRTDVLELLEGFEQ